MQAWGSGAIQKRQTLDLIDIRRNPYLVDYEEQRRARGSGKAVNGRSLRSELAVNGSRRRQPEAGYGRNRRQVEATGGESRRRPETVNGRNRRQPARTNADCQLHVVPVNRQRNVAAARRRRKKQIRRRRIMIAELVLCGFMISCLFLLKFGNISQAEQGGSDSIQEPVSMEEGLESFFASEVQGIPEAEFAKHPAWTEDFLPLNEYSRPGEALPEVNDIFVHYTANPGTSAAQNRSYFEQQKDMHEASVSAHFIIGYDGEIMQCVPLDEIAYAVQTRNYDSISIECCYKAEDGSFTQETYDSLISLLAWLTDVYGLDTGHILRHYDCGGKKCPLYYTEHEDAWELLKRDVTVEKTGG